MIRPESLPDSYFHDMYAADDDPWGFADRWYERRKYALTLAALTRPRYPRVFEPGCSIGVLSAALAERADHLLCTDVSPRAVELAAGRLAVFGDRVHLAVGDVLADWPEGRFDLIVLSEVLYYLAPADLDTVIDRLPGSLTPSGEIIAVHWRHEVPEYPQTGDAVHDRLLTSDLQHVGGYVDDDLRLDVLVRELEQSVAERENLVG
ncbi:class I SAM-dependent methyltransferase [Gordonia sp. ABSL11-1]|uniref:class I SAM-dependent DNA methyltransferase n=1 Tax=Gordonia sp. ABSL11-1 TaxID=3053924 RepID=UPI002573D062|nr:class I SAM-dependent methyltransferase [Gordonia sp. ABSL11-1]MDL9947360.1 class I SAM-dependent methyltransferase [Gordonia sp. ABSL11-1]